MEPRITDDAAYLDALETGHLETLHAYWTGADAAAYKARTFPSRGDFGNTVTAILAARGHLSSLQLARAMECPWDDSTCAYAAMGGHLDIGS